jgi:2-oxoglutarate ferredoxin oxidoreductase subunit alpha
MDINIRIAGEAGQGVQSAGLLLVGAFSGVGLHVLSSQSYMSRVRGGLNWYDIRIADNELFGPSEQVDLLVALTGEARKLLADCKAEGGITLFAGNDGGEDAIAIDFVQIAKDTAENAVMANTVAAGCVFAMLGYDLDELCHYLATQFKKKGDEVISQNVACAKAGYELGKAYADRLKAPKTGVCGCDYAVNGAEALGLGACTAGIKFVSAYPMTPGTAVFSYFASNDHKFGLVVEQAEDEIAAMNLICGASYAGAPAATATSGGGFALMVEGMSLAGMMELPVVVFLAQRPGPATGMPTRTAQGELRMCQYAGHGEFPRAIFAPGTQQQCYDLARRAVEIAHKHQSPVIVLTDQFLQDAQKNIPRLDETYRPVDRCIVSAGADYERYAITDSGVSPRAIPGGGAPVICDSDGHDEAGHITEDLGVHVAQYDKRLAKEAGLVADAVGPELYGPGDAPNLLICWGSTYGPCREAVDQLNAAGKPTAMLHFSQVWPIDVDAVRRAIGDRERIFCVEGNATGQLAALLAEARVLDEPPELLLRYDGLAFSAGWIIKSLSDSIDKLNRTQP